MAEMTPEEQELARQERIALQLESINPETPPLPLGPPWPF